MALPTIAVPNFSGGSVTVYTANSGRQAAADSAAVVLSNEDKAVQDAIKAAVESTNPVGVYDAYNGDFEFAAASATAQAMGATGAIGDKLSHVIIQPLTTSPGSVVIKDGANTIYTFPAGTTAPADLEPIIVPFGLVSKNGAFTITTGTNVTATGIGKFT